VEPEIAMEDCSVALRRPSPPSSIAIERVGASPSITRSALAARELVSPGVARLRMAALPAASLMIPPSRMSAVEDH